MAATPSRIVDFVSAIAAAPVTAAAGRAPGRYPATAEARGVGLTAVRSLLRFWPDIRRKLHVYLTIIALTFAANAISLLVPARDEAHNLPRKTSGYAPRCLVAEAIALASSERPEDRRLGAALADHVRALPKVETREEGVRRIERESREGFDRGRSSSPRK